MTLGTAALGVLRAGVQTYGVRLGTGVLEAVDPVLGFFPGVLDSAADGLGQECVFAALGNGNAVLGQLAAPIAGKGLAGAALAHGLQEVMLGVVALEVGGTLGADFVGGSLFAAAHALLQGLNLRGELVHAGVDTCQRVGHVLAKALDGVGVVLAQVVHLFAELAELVEALLGCLLGLVVGQRLGILLYGGDTCVDVIHQCFHVLFHDFF